MNLFEITVVLFSRLKLKLNNFPEKQMNLLYPKVMTHVVDQSYLPDGSPGQILPINTFEKTYVCNTCSRSYQYIHNLRRHKQFECGKAPTFQCPHCTYKAKQKSTLKLHMKRIHHYVDKQQVQRVKMPMTYHVNNQVNV